jgi:hypothetical protein
MYDNQLLSTADPSARGLKAAQILAKAFARAGWLVSRQPKSRNRGAPRPDMVVHRRGASYVVEVKAAAEGRSDRLVPLWSQAYLQVLRAAGAGQPPLAVVAAPRIAPRVAEHVLEFARDYAPNAAAGVIDFAGLRLFRGPELDDLNAASAQVPPHLRAVRRESANLFSDLNQWMLKVLLAPEIPERLLSAPRGRYRNASELARAAKVSVMSAFRLVQLLRLEGYLDESAPYLGLVRREELFRRWQSSVSHRVFEMPMRFLLRGDPEGEMQRILGSGTACLALFAAAEALNLGFVRGVPPYVYVRRPHHASVAEWKSIVPAAHGEAPDLIIRQAPSFQSVFRGLVRADGKPVCDVLQVWLDVFANPSRGREQADLIRRRVLNSVMRGETAGG